MKKLRLLLALALVTFSCFSNAGFNDPWYLMYKVSGGTIVQTMGPFGTRMECMGAKYQLPFGSTFLGCAQ